MDAGLYAGRIFTLSNGVKRSPQKFALDNITKVLTKLYGSVAAIEAVAVEDES